MITKVWPAAVLVLILLPSLAIARATATLDQQLLEAAEHGNLKLVKTLLEKGADVNSKHEYGWTTVMLAVLKGHAAVVTLLVDKGADVNRKGPRGTTALIEAARKGSLELVNVLLNKGADVNAVDDDGRNSIDDSGLRGSPGRCEASRSERCSHQRYR